MMFTADVTQKLGFYVYRLVDPRNQETFYVGKGTGNRVYHHMASATSYIGDAVFPKLERIRSIINDGFVVEHYIHRHGMDEGTAFHVEAALIDVYPNLTNAVRGHHTDLYGCAHSDDIRLRYQAEEARWHHAMLIVSINRTGKHRSHYDAARFAWKLGAKSRSSIQYVLATQNGMIVACFVPKVWLPATLENFPEAEKGMPGRWGFVGDYAAGEIAQLYVDKRLPPDCNLSQHGIRYVGRA